MRKIYFFSKIFKTKGNNNVSHSNGTEININDGDGKLSDYCRNMINKLMDENQNLIISMETIRKDQEMLLSQNEKLANENKKLKKMLKHYLDND